MNKSVIIDAVRSPIGLKHGQMIGIRPDDLTAQVIKGLMDKNPTIHKESIDDVVVGCAYPEGPQGHIIGKSVGVLAGLPIESTGKVVNRFCGSSMDAIHQLSTAAECGDVSVAIAAGVEDMFSVPMGGFAPDFHPELAEQEYYIGMGETAENLAKDLNISRQDQEEFAMNSHRKALKAYDEGKFEKELIPINVNGETTDELVNNAKPDGSKKRNEIQLGFIAQEIQAIEQQYGYSEIKEDGSTDKDTELVVDTTTTQLGLQYGKYLSELEIFIEFFLGTLIARAGT